VYRFWLFRGFLVEGSDWLGRLLALPGAAAPTVGRAKALAGAAGLADHNGESETRVLGLAEEAAELWRALGNDARLAYVLVLVAGPTLVIGRRTRSMTTLDKALGLWEEALGLTQRAGDRAIEALILKNLGRQVGDLYGYAYLLRDLSAEDAARRAAARPLLEQALGVASDVGYTKIRIQALYYLASMSYGDGDLAASRQQAESALILARDVGDKMEMGGILVLVGCVAADYGDRGHARQFIAEAVELGVDGFRFGRGQGGLVGCALALAHLAASVGRLDEAILLDTAVATSLRTLGSSGPS
jgi:tetratricopeptide (TPR) repeat protein